MIKSRAMLLAGVSALAMLACAGEAKADPPFITPGMFSFTVPTTGEYALDVLGASGGASINAVGGLGAEVSGDIVLTAGETLTLFVGGQGQNAGLFFGGGGGGFVFLGTSVLAVAGGGGGAGYRANGGPGQTGTGGGAGGGPFGGAGGANGTGGGGGTYAHLNGGGGAGVASGAAGYGGDGAGIDSGSGAKFPNGGGGSGFNGGGGGGGFSGGGGGDGEGSAGDGGGGSYLASLFTNPILTAGVHSGDGSISINLLPPAVPEPTTWAMTLAGFAGLGWLAHTQAQDLARLTGLAPRSVMAGLVPAIHVFDTKKWW
jgi:hypothetical protein